MNHPTLKTLTAVLAVAALAATLMLAGCSDDAASPAGQTLTGGDDYENLDFTQPNGGLTATDEEPAFGDKAFEDLLYTEDMQASDDPVLEDPEVLHMDDLANDPADSTGEGRPRFTFVRLEWGMIHGPDDSLVTPGDCPPLDWSGAVAVDRGIVVATLLVRFELPFDHLVRPRPDRRTLGFISHTYCHFDGLVLKIIERPEDIAPDTEPNMLHISTGPFTRDFTLRELVDMNENFPVDDLGNSMHIVGYAGGNPNVCPKGFLRGRWRLLPEPAEDDTTGVIEPGLAVQYGTFGGPWLGLGGGIRGFMNCGYGLDVDGNQVFFGKRIDRFGRFVAFVNGTWTAAEDRISLAGFNGDWVTEDGMREGELGGNAYPYPGYDGGFYEGRWAALCDPDTGDDHR